MNENYAELKWGMGKGIYSFMNGNDTLSDLKIKFIQAMELVDNLNIDLVSDIDKIEIEKFKRRYTKENTEKRTDLEVLTEDIVDFMEFYKHIDSEYQFGNSE